MASRRCSRPINSPRICRSSSGPSALRAQVDYPVDGGSSGALQGPVELGPALVRHLAGELGTDLMFGPRPKLDRRQFLRPGPEAPADVFAMDYEVASALLLAAEDQMDMRVVGVPVVDRDPLEPSSEVPLHLPDQVPGIGVKIGQFRGVLRADDEPEMMPVICGSPGKVAGVRVLALGIEHPCRLAVPGHPLAAKIGEMCT